MAVNRDGMDANKVIFDHEKLDVYQLSISYVASVRRDATSLKGIDRPIRDQWTRASQSIPLNIAEGNGKQSLRDKSRFFEIARASALECAAIHDVLVSIQAIDGRTLEAHKTSLRRIVAMLTRLIQRSGEVREERAGYDYQVAEYE